LILEFVQVSDRTVRQVWSFKDETLRHVTASSQMIEHNQIAAEEPVRWALKHRSDTDGFCDDARRGRSHFFGQALGFHQLMHELLHGASTTNLVDGDVRFVNVRE